MGVYFKRRSRQITLLSEADPSNLLSIHMSQPSEIFKLKRANEWIAESKTKPVPKMLFGEFWLEGELSILFADTGKGKSILAVQIAESIARGRPIELMELTAKPQTVLYFDFELSEKQFEMRYAPDAEEGQEYLTDHYDFSDNFYRAEIDVDAEPPEDFETFEEYLRVGIENNIRSIDAKVVIVDNITWLRGASDTARRSLIVMRELKRLKRELGLSILVLAHTPKRDLARRITVNDLQGSKILSNFADNVFAIGQSNVDAAFRYVKHIKPRSTELICDASNVLVGEIRKWEKNFLGFRFTHFSDETAHLSRSISGIRTERVDIVASMSEGGMSQREIARDLGISASSVNRYLQISRDDDDYDFNSFDEDYDQEQDVPEDLEERYQKFLKDFNIPDPRIKMAAAAATGERYASGRCKHDPYGYNRQHEPDFLRVHGETCPGDDFNEPWRYQDDDEPGP